MRHIALMNQKGGVGKTTCAVNLGAALALQDRRVLLVDLDPQANLTVHLGIDINTLERGTYDVLLNDAGIEDVVHRDRAHGLSVVPTNLDLSGAELELVSAVGRETLLRDALQRFVREEAASGRPLDFVIVDCPPSLGLLSLNALTACDEVFIPLQCEFFALQGLSKLLDVVRLVGKRLNPRVRLSGIVPSMVSSRTNLSREVLAEIESFFPKRVFRTRVRQNVRLAEAPSHGRTVFEYEPGCRGAEDFAMLAREVLAMETDDGRIAAPREVDPFSGDRRNAPSEVNSAGG